MKTEPAKVVILSVGDQQYPQDDLGRVIEKVWNGVKSLPSAEVVCTCKIMNDPDADAAVKEVGKLNKIDAFIVNYVSWHITPYVMRVLKDYTQIPVLVWGIGGWHDAGGKLIAPAATAGTTAFVPAAKALGIRTHLVNQKPDEELRLEDVDRFLRVIAAVKAVKHSRIGLFGYADMGLYSCAYNKTLAYDKLGVDIEDYLAYDLVEKMNAYTKEQVAEAIAEVRASFKPVNNVTDEMLDKPVRLYLVMKDKKEERHLDAVSIKCVYGVTQMGFNSCLAQSMLADKDTCVICECDAYGMATGIMLSRVTGKQSGFVEHYEVFDDCVLVGVCGFIPKEFADGEPKIRSANLGEYNTGISNVSKLKTGHVTFARLFEEDGKYKMFLTTGEAMPNPKWTEHGWCEPTPDFPAVLLKPNMDMQHYQEVVPGQHVIMVYGEHEKDMELFCKFMDIEVVR